MLVSHVVKHALFLSVRALVILFASFLFINTPIANAKETCNLTKADIEKFKFHFKSVLSAEVVKGHLTYIVPDDHDKRPEAKENNDSKLPLDIYCEDRAEAMALGLHATTRANALPPDDPDPIFRALSNNGKLNHPIRIAIRQIDDKDPSKRLDRIFTIDSASIEVRKRK